MNDHDQLPTLLDILNDIAFREELIVFDKSHFSFFFNTQNVADKFEVAQTSNGDFVLSPIPLLWNTFYRGESSIHKPCKASIYRENMTEEKCFIERVKTSELGLLIDYYSLSQIYREGITLPIINNEDQVCHLIIDYFALAQHYGIKTDLIDFTSDKWVAAFFASTEYRNGTYYPIEDNSKEGMFYIYNPRPEFPEIEVINQFRPVGLQPFSRPGEQKGFVLQLNKDDDLNKMCITKIRFKHDKNVSHLIFNYSNRSNKLFPKDILEIKANSIKNSEVFSYSAVETTKKLFYQDVDEHTWKRLISTSGLLFQEKAIVAFTPEEIDDFITKWEKTDKNRFLKQLIYRKVYMEDEIKKEYVER